MNEEGGLGYIVTTVLSRWLTVLLTAAIFTGAAVLLASARTPQYSATSILLTGQDRGLGDVGSIVELNQATQSLSALITERVVVRDAAKLIDYDGDVDDLVGRVMVNVPSNTQIIQVTVVDTGPRRAARVANAIARTFSTLVEERSSESSKLTAVVWQLAEPDDEPVGPSRSMIGIAGLLAGLFIGGGLALIREHLDGRWRSEADVEEWLGIPVLGLIPDIGRRRVRRTAYR